MKERNTRVVLTEEQKARAYTPEQIGDALYAKLKDDPNYALMSLFCTNIGVFLANYVEPRPSEQETFSPRSMSFENKMWNWDYIECVYLRVDRGYRDEDHRMLYVDIPFTDGTDRKMSGLLKSGAEKEILDYLRSPEFGPKLMITLDDFNTALQNHD